MKHIIDQAHGTRGTRLRRYAVVERMRGRKVRGQVDVMRRMPKGLSSSLRVRRFLAIERAAL
ncbi:MAG: hypothetical protein AAGK37_13195 [Pseudomonadota bacterium]